MEKFLKGFIYAFKGLKYTFITQLNFKVHTVALGLVVLVGIYFRLTLNEWLWISLAIGLVLITELVNTAIEVLVDLVRPDYHFQAGIVKDVAAAAVLVAALLALVIATLIFIPKFI